MKNNQLSVYTHVSKRRCTSALIWLRIVGRRKRNSLNGNRNEISRTRESPFSPGVEKGGKSWKEKKKKEKEKKRRKRRRRKKDTGQDARRDDNTEGNKIKKKRERGRERRGKKKEKKTYTRRNIIVEYHDGTKR